MADPATFYSLKQWPGDLIFHWKQLVYSVMEKQWMLLSLCYYLIDIVNIKIISPKLDSAPLSDHVE